MYVDPTVAIAVMCVAILFADALCVVMLRGRIDFAKRTGWGLAPAMDMTTIFMCILTLEVVAAVICGFLLKPSGVVIACVLVVCAYCAACATAAANAMPLKA